MACCVIASLINLIDILDKVVNYDVAFSRMLEYLGLTLAPRMLDLLNIMMVLAGLIAMGELGRRLELVAMRAAGISDRKLLGPIVLLSVISFAIVFWAELRHLPELQRRGDLIKSQLRYGEKTPPPTDPFYVQIGNVSMQSSGYIPGTDEFPEVRLFIFENGRISEVYHAKKLAKSGRTVDVHVPFDTGPSMAGGGGWNFYEGFYRKVDSSTGQVIKYEPFEHLNYPGALKPPPEFIYEASNRRNLVQWLPMEELLDARSFAARQEIHRRIAVAIATGIGLLVGACFGMKMDRFNAARAVCLAILIGFAYRMAFDGCLAIGMETGASWVCHFSNVFLAAMIFPASFLTSAPGA